MHAALTTSPELIKLLAHDLRWGMLQALAISDYQVNELVDQLHQPMNLVSYHLKKLRAEALVTTRRSDADARDVYYSLDLERLHQRFWEAGIALHPRLGVTLPVLDVTQLAPYRVLFVCTHNSARSQMAQALLHHLSAGRLTVVSAGSHPTHVHPDAVKTMQALGIDISRQGARSLQAVSEQPFDYVITVCDKAREVCPTFPGQGAQMHWGLPDPTAIQDDQARAAAFTRTAHQLQARITYFLATLPTVERNEI